MGPQWFFVLIKNKFLNFLSFTFLFLKTKKKRKLNINQYMTQIMILYYIIYYLNKSFVILTICVCIYMIWCIIVRDSDLIATFWQVNEFVLFILEEIWILFFLLFLNFDCLKFISVTGEFVVMILVKIKNNWDLTRFDSC